MMTLPTVTDSGVPPAWLNAPAPGEAAPVWDKPVAAGSVAPAFFLLGAHGGAGVSTLARMWAPAADAGGGFPAADRHRFVVVVARCHRVGLAGAHRVLLQGQARQVGGCQVVGVVTIPAAPGRMPKTLVHQRTVIEAAAPAAWRLPFIPALLAVEEESLPVWSPRDKPVEGKKRRARDPVDAYAEQVAQVGALIFESIKALHKQQKERM